MFIRRFILSIAVLLGCFQSAAATPACDGVDEVLRTASILRGAPSLTSDTQYSDVITNLERPLSRISLSALQPEPYRDAFPAESRALFEYLSNLRSAVVSSQAGYDEDAAKILGAADPAIISDSLLTLTRYWECTNSLSSGNIEGPVEGKSAFENNIAAPTEETDNIKMSASSSGETLAETKSRTDVLAQSVSNGPKLDIKGHPFLSIAIALALIALIYSARKYSKRSRMRDHRHLIHQDMSFKFGKKQYQMTVIDITQRGLKFKHDGLIKRQRRVAIKLGNDWHSCRLVWKNANFAGAKFRTPLKDETMNALLAAAHPEGIAESVKTHA